MNKENLTTEKLSHLETLSELYPNMNSVVKEIIDLKAILNLPKGTEHFLSDLHGEYETFAHILNNCSGVIKEKAKQYFGDSLTPHQIEELCTLIYYPKEKLKLLRKENKLDDEKYREILKALIGFATFVSSKYTRSKVRKALPEDFSFIIDELMHAQNDEDDNQAKYHEQIYNSITETTSAEQFIFALTELIKRLAVDHLHIIGDIFDRGGRADKVLDTLMNYHSLDIQWGNHDILWMGASSGNKALVATVIYLSIKYNTYQVIENGYGISLRHLISFAEKQYGTADTMKQALNAIAIIMFKLEGQLVLAHPEYQLQNRLLLDKIDFENCTIDIDGKTHQLPESCFATVDKNNPYKLTKDEQNVIDKLANDFLESSTLNKHISFLFAKGSIYTKYNNNLLYHGCIPLDENGNLKSFMWDGKEYKGKSLLDYYEQRIRSAYFNRDENSVDLVWYLWCALDSPLFGRVLKTFERHYIEDSTTHKENTNFYYNFVDCEKTAEMILQEFGMSGNCHIINGHTPIARKAGESPIKANGKVFVIDGGFCKAYHNKTGTAGYTLIFNSHGLRLKAHKPFLSIEKALTTNADILSESDVVEQADFRIYVKDTDGGKKIQSKIADLELLLNCYRKGIVSQKGKKQGQ